VHIGKENIVIKNPDGEAVELFLKGEKTRVNKGGSVFADL
jgi:hypothetical protein